MPAEVASRGYEQVGIVIEGEGCYNCLVRDGCRGNGKAIRMKNREKAQEVARQVARDTLRQVDPVRTAYLSDTKYVPAGETGGFFEVNFWGEDYQVAYPEGSVRNLKSGEEAGFSVELLLLHYLIRADGTHLADRWVAFRELPDALTYDPAFQGRTSVPLIRTYGHDRDGFVAAARALGGEHLSFGDASFMFALLPRVRMAIVLHLGDDEFPPAVTVLFDAATGHYLPTEDLAVLGGIVCGALRKHGR